MNERLRGSAVALPMATGACVALRTGARLVKQRREEGCAAHLLI